MSDPSDTWFDPSSSQTVRVPESLREIFESAQDNVRRYFTSFNADPATGRIEIGDERYVLVRASALSIDFLNTVAQLYGDRASAEAEAIGRAFLFDIAHTIGKNDARAFHQRMGLTNPIDRLAAGPVHFAFSGWALVEIKQESGPTPDEDFFLAYDHPYSFEADSWLRSGRESTTPVCIMNAGYSSGWCEESYGMPLTAVEIACRARGDDTCSFLMAPPHRMEEQLRERAPTARLPLTIPSYFGRKREEDALRRSERRLGSILAALPLPVLIAADDSTLLYCNTPATETFGLDPDARERLSGLGLFEATGALADLFDTVKRQEEIVGRELVLRNAEGRRFSALVSCHALLLPGGERGTVITVLDVTSYNRAQAALRVNERMATVGTLAAGVAHEINNPLAYVIANLERLAVMVEKSESVPEKADLKVMRSSINHALEGAERVKRIVGDLRALSRDDPEPATAVALEEILEQAIRIAEVTWRHRATIERDYRGGSLVLANRGRLAQVVLNLIMNAAQAIPEGAIESNSIRIATRPSDEARHELIVEDTGCGMSDDQMAQIFEPFYTSKRPSEGTGLGLAIARRIVEDLGGEIEVDSELGRGTTLRVVLPAAESEVASESEQPTPIPVPRRDLSGVSILIIDDEPALTEVLAEMLDEFNVTIASSGREALAVLAAESFEVVLCDLMMPDVTGVELYERCSPVVRETFVFMTGGAFTESAQRFIRTVDNLCLEKPVDLEELRRAVANQLEKRTAS